MGTVGWERGKANMSRRVNSWEKYAPSMRNFEQGIFWQGPQQGGSDSEVSDELLAFDIVYLKLPLVPCSRPSAQTWIPI